MHAFKRRAVAAESLLSRRDLLRFLASAGALALTAGKGFAQSSGPIMRTIPSSGETLRALGLGTSDAFEAGTGEAERAPLREVLKIFHSAGGRLIDSSPMYGTAESVVGDLLRQTGLSKQVFRATKVWSTGREAGIRQMQESERRMGGERLDLIQVHNLVDMDTQLATLREWKAAGRIRYLGVTHYTVAAQERLEQIVRAEKLDFIQINYSLAEPEAANRLLPACADRGVAVLVNRPFADGRMFRAVRGKEVPAWAAEFDARSWAQFFLKFSLAHPAATCVIPATSKPQHMEDNMRAGTGRLPDAAQQKRMLAHFAAL
jgi:diketogulonate reductase-like aldo/keto reductase